MAHHPLLKMLAPVSILLSTLLHDRADKDLGLRTTTTKPKPTDLIPNASDPDKPKEAYNSQSYILPSIRMRKRMAFLDHDFLKQQGLIKKIKTILDHP